MVLARAARPERDPVLPLRAAAAAAQAGLPLSLHAVRRLAAVARPLPTPWPAEAREQLVTLLGSGRPTVDVWEALEAEGLITRLLPDWERVRCRPQRNAVHIWTVDRHLIETAVRASEFTRRVHRPDLLLVAALLHDIGKGWPGDHSVAGEIIAKDVAARIGFDRDEVAVLSTLVRHHLLLVDTATRRDLEDPATVRAVAEAVGSQSTLELLHALTEADALATGPAAWSSWRGSLVADLVKRVAAVLAGDVLDEPEAAAPTAEQERLAIEAIATGSPVLSLRAQTEPPAGEQPSGEPEPLGVELLIAVPDQPGVLPAVAGVLAMHRLTVRTAELRALDLPDGVEGAVLLLDWRVAAEYGSLPQAARLRADLVRALDGSLDIAGRLAERDAAYPRRRGVVAPPPRVAVASAASRLATVIEVRSQDAPGLLFRIGRALEDADVRVRSAHVSTLGANAVDAFYVTGARGRTAAGRGGGVAGAEAGGDIAGLTGCGTGGDDCLARPDTLEDAHTAPDSEDRRRRVRYSLRSPLSDLQESARQGASERGGHRRHRARDPHRPPRSGRGPARRADVHQERQGACPRRRGLQGSLNPAQQVLKIVNEELVTILGGETRRLRFAKQPADRDHARGSAGRR